MDRAARFLRAGNSQAASKLVSKELAQFVLGDPIVSPYKLIAASIDFKQWKSCVYDLLLKSAENTATTWNDWLLSLKEAFENNVELLTGKRRPLGSYFKRDSEESYRMIGDASTPETRWKSNFTVKTIHQVKGTEFETVVAFYPKPGPHDPCPSKDWWLSGRCEERRIVYVAVTRAMSNLILCVHRDTFVMLQQQQPEFIALFKILMAG